MSILGSLIKGIFSAPAAGRAVASSRFATKMVDSGTRKFLHVGCGYARKPDVSPGLAGDEWTEISLDIDPGVEPDVVASILDMFPIGSGTFDAVYSSHNLEHLFFHEVPVALREFRRVLKEDGLAVISCPDAQSICALVAEGRLLETAYDSPVGPIAPIDMLWGHGASVAEGKFWMAHKCGFTAQVLAKLLQDGGFASVKVLSRPSPFFDLWALASPTSFPLHTFDSLAKLHFPTQDT